MTLVESNQRAKGPEIQSWISGLFGRFSGGYAT